MHGVLFNANGLDTLFAMQAAVLSGVQSLQRDVLQLAAKHASCMLPPL